MRQLSYAGSAAHRRRCCGEGRPSRQEAGSCRGDSQEEAGGGGGR